MGMNCHVTNLPKATGMVSFLLLSLSLSCFGLCFYIVLKVESIIHLFQEIKESGQSDSRHLRQEYHKITECIYDKNIIKFLFFPPLYHVITIPHLIWQVANFCSAEDDGSFWSRWIKPDAISQAEVCVCIIIIFF